MSDARRLAVLVLFAIALTTLVPLVAGIGFPAYADTEDDSLLVYCLSPAQHTGLQEAAVALGYATRDRAGSYVLLDGQKLDPLSWRENHIDDFSRACRALWAAQRPPNPGPALLATALPFLTALVGAMGGLTVATWRDRVARGHTLADDLRSAFEEFRQAVTVFLERWDGDDSLLERMLERRGVLLTQLSRAKAAHRRWTTTVRRVEDELKARFDRVDMDGPDKKEIVTALGKIQKTVFRLAHALERPMRPHPSLSAKATGKQS